MVVYFQFSTLMSYFAENNKIYLELSAWKTRNNLEARKSNTTQIKSELTLYASMISWITLLEFEDNVPTADFGIRFFSSFQYLQK